MARKLVFATALLLAVVVVWMLASLSQPHIQRLWTQGMAIEGLPHLPIYAITLLDAPGITRSSGHPHIPGGVTGTNQYLFDGKIDINDNRFSLRSVDYAPIAAVEINSQMYVVAQGFFTFNRHGFLIYLRNPHNRFDLLPFGQIPRELWRIRFQDSDQTCSYRTWLLRGLSEQVSHNTALECFRILFRLDPRFGFLSNWKADETKSFGEDVSWFLQNVIIPNRAITTLPDIVIMLNATKESDDPHIIAVLCECITKLNPVQATGIICEFKSSIPDISNQDDARAYVFIGFPFLQKLHCASTNRAVQEPGR